MNPEKCPECKSHDTRHEWTDDLGSQIEKLFSCGECGTSYSVWFDAFDKGAHE